MGERNAPPEERFRARIDTPKASCCSRTRRPPPDARAGAARVRPYRRGRAPGRRTDGLGVVPALPRPHRHPRSHSGGDVVELAGATGVVAVRDGKDPDGPVLLLSRAALRAAETRRFGGRGGARPANGRLEGLRSFDDLVDRYPELLRRPRGQLRRRDP
ncbi:DUF397 domain-containing protein [Actinomadura citrea]|uniref:DUF397 domain-containing protein n=1 Tax=Actinomadura citrea TaxID=46158 RepID=UPI0027E5613E|nr:DUF397 domain-containing protein [Actinomadura citrea]